MDKKTKRRSEFRRAQSENMSREQAMLKNRKKRMSILKRRRRMLLLMIVAIAACIMLAVMSSMGMFEKPSTKTTLSVKKDGSITFEEVEEAGSDMAEGELEAYSKDAINEYNEKAGRGAVKLKKCDVSDGKVYLKTTYQDASDYAAFTGLEFFGGTVQEALDEGYLFNNAFVSVSGGEKKKEAQKADVKKGTEHHVIILNQPICVNLPGDILYVTGDDTVLESPRAVQIENPMETYIVYE